MKKNTFFIALLALLPFLTTAQTAMDFSGLDCNGTAHHLFSDLDAGKAVIIEYFMPNCASCPPPAQKIQTMANNILANHPGVITAYAFPFNNTTTCTYSSSWVSTNGLSLFAPMDSGATQVAHYGGFGMPTIVVLGGSSHRTMFKTLSFATSDTTIMRDSILRLIGALPNGVNALEPATFTINIAPNPVQTSLSVEVNAINAGLVNIQLISMTGQVEQLISNTTVTGTKRFQFATGNYATGMYILQTEINGQINRQKVLISNN